MCKYLQYVVTEIKREETAVQYSVWKSCTFCILNLTWTWSTVNCCYSGLTLSVVSNNTISLQYATRQRAVGHQCEQEKGAQHTKKCNCGTSLYKHLHSRILHRSPPPLSCDTKLAPECRRKLRMQSISLWGPEGSCHLLSLCKSVPGMSLHRSHPQELRVVLYFCINK